MPAFLARPSAAQIDALRATLSTALTAYASYRETAARHGVTLDLARRDPLDALARLPLFDPAAINHLADEALTARGHDLGGVELSSGTSGGAPKRRVLSEEDVSLDAALLTRLMRLAGVRAGDRVAAVDVSPSPLSLAFLEACERLGARESVALALMPAASVDAVHRLDPTVLIASPSMLRQLAAETGSHPPRPTVDCRLRIAACEVGQGPSRTPHAARRSQESGALTGRSDGAAVCPSLRLIIYNGERLPERLAGVFRSRGVGVRSLYGLTETSALGVACAAEQGVHLCPDHALAEVRTTERAQELIVTTLGFSMPLLRYPTGDRVRVLRGRCPCGSPWPRVEILGRLGDRFSLYELKFTPEEFQALLLEEPGDTLQIVLDLDAAGRERMTFRVTEACRARLRGGELRRRLCTHPLLDYLLHAGLVRVRLGRLPLTNGRKPRALIDRRGHGHDGR